jgi:5-methylcytosine-specific restriction endonuclease McrA
MRKRVSSKQRIRDFLIEHVGKVVDSKQIRDAAGTDVSEWARRVRELREDERWPIVSHNDRSDLKPGQYILTALPPGKGAVTFSKPISAKLRAAVLDRNGFTCQMCGLTPGDVDEDTGRKVRLHIGHIVDKSLGGKDEHSNLRALCSSCNQGAKNVTTEKPGRIWLLAQVRRAGQEEQLAVLAWLKRKYPLG